MVIGEHGDHTAVVRKRAKGGSCIDIVIVIIQHRHMVVPGVLDTIGVMHGVILKIVHAFGAGENS